MRRLSVIVSARNDDYEGDFLYRLRGFLYSLIALDAEVIIVEWNPPCDHLPLAEELTDTRPHAIITVPNEIHRTIENSDKIQLFEYIAKNVGIRRAQGEFILCTNPDNSFSVEMVERLNGDAFNPSCFYRANRHDVDTLGNIVVVNSYQGEGLHYDASGDFMMMHRDAWFRIKGFLEIPKLHHMDSFSVYEASKNGLQQVVLSEKIFHREHTREVRIGLPSIIWDLNALENVRKSDSWGFASHEFNTVRG